jgi:hypothetical protein
MDDRTSERIARNDATFREANEGIAAAAVALDLADRIPFICECAEPACTAIVPMPRDEYEAIRADSTHFLNAPGHDVAAQEAGRKVGEERGYVVVEKLGRAAEVVADLDARSPEAT